MKNFTPSNLRKTVLDMAYAGSTVHIPCAFSIIEILSVLYGEFLKNPEQQAGQAHDYFILSKGHGVMAVYACLKELGLLNELDIQNYFKDGTKLKGLSDCHVKGLEVTSGSLGHGLSVACGMALALKFKKSSQKIYCLVGDGESNEGAIWEALLFAAHWKLNQLVVIFDCNGYQAMGPTDEVMNLNSMSEKLKAFNFETLEVNGHSSEEVRQAFQKFQSSSSDQPKALIAQTVKGQGLSFMQGQNHWHYTRLTRETYEAALKELGV